MCRDPTLASACEQAFREQRGGRPSASAGWADGKREKERWTEEQGERERVIMSDAGLLADVLDHLSWI